MNAGALMSPVCPLVSYIVSQHEVEKNTDESENKKEDEDKEEGASIKYEDEKYGNRSVVTTMTLLWYRFNLYMGRRVDTVTRIL